MAHTPTPWKLSEPANPKFRGHMVFIGSPHERGGYRGEIAIVQGAEHIGGITDAEAMANAAFIVRAVNAHEPLVEALEGMVVALRAQAQLANQLGGEIAVNEGNGPAWTKAKAALSLAKGEAEK